MAIYSLASWQYLVGLSNRCSSYWARISLHFIVCEKTDRKESTHKEVEEEIAMYPKHFFEQYWEGEQENQIFVGMAFDGSVDKRFEIINNASKKVGFDKSFRVGIETEANSINDRIFNGIANSKLLIFDLSEDNRDNRINSNVIYELGIANAVREPFDIVLIRKNLEKKLKLPFDIQGLHINFFDELTEEFIEKIITSALKNQEWHKSKRVEFAAKSIDENGLNLMYTQGGRPKGFNHFNSTGWGADRKMSLLRLIDLGIVQFDCICIQEKGYYEWAYHWTSFGYEVMKHLGINQIPLEDFEKTPDYKEVKKANEDYQKNKENALGVE